MKYHEEKPGCGAALILLFGVALGLLFFFNQAFELVRNLKEILGR